MKSLFKNDLNWVVAGIAATLVLVSMTVVAGIPFFVATVPAVCTFGGLVLLLAPKKRFEGFDARSIGASRVALASDLLEVAAPSVETLRLNAKAITDTVVADRIGHLETVAREVFDRVEAAPEQAPKVGRFLNYYLPQAAMVSQAYVAIESMHSPDPEQVASLRSTITRLDEAFVHYADNLAEAELGTLDVELRLISQSIEQDIGRR